MTDIPITGKIISVTVEDEAAPFGFASYTDDDSSGPKTTIGPTGNKLSIYSLSHAGSGSHAGFTLSDDFEIGDVVEIYKSDAVSTGQIIVFDTTGHTLMTNGGNNNIKVASRVRKILSGTGSDWLILVG